MKTSIFTKLTAFFVVVMFMFTLVPAGVAFAGDAEYQFVLTADKTSVEKGDTVILTVTVNGDVKDFFMVSYSIKFANQSFSVTTEGRLQKTFESEWYSYVTNPDPKDTTGEYNGGIGAIAIPSKGQYVDEKDSSISWFNSIIADSTNGYTIDPSCPSYGDESIVAGKVVFTALKDVDNIAQAFELTNAELQTKLNATTPSVMRTTEVVQIVDNTPSGPSQQATDAITAIGNIGTVEYTAESKALIDTAKEKYDLAEDKENIENAQTLTDAIAQYDELKTAAVTSAKTAIDEIGTVEYTLDSKALIAAAQAEYDKVLDADKQDITNAKALTDAITFYDALKKTRVDAAKTAIDEIGTVEYTLDSKALIAAAQAEYDKVLDTDKQDITNAKALTDAKDSYADLKTKAVKDAKDSIDAIGTVKYTTESKNLIDLAQMAYDKVLTEDKAEVINYTTLTNAIERYNQLKADIDGAVELVIGKIDNLPADIALADENAVNSAKTSYLAINEEYRYLVTNYEKLEDAIEKIALLKQEVEDVKTAIANIPEEITLSDKEDIEGIRADYDALTDEQQVLVDDTKLVLAEGKIAKIEADMAAAQEFDDMADGLSSDITLDDEEYVVALRNKYDNLTEKQREYVENLSILEDAEEKIYDLNEAKKVDDKILALGEITLEDDAAITAARKAYIDLTDKQQSYVENLSILEAAEEEIARLKAEANQEAIDRAAAAGVDNKILELPDEITLEDEALVEAAREAYEALTETQKGFVLPENLSKLEEAEAIINEIKDDMLKAKEVDDAINALGEITIDDDEAISAAREAYEDLSDIQKEYVNNLSKLEEAEEKIAKIKEDISIADGVKELISQIGEVEYTTECKELIKAARDAYEALTIEQQALVDNYSVLTDAEAKYEELAPKVTQTANAVEGYANVYVTVFKDIDEGRKVTLGGNTAKMFKLEDAVYYIVLTDEKIDIEDAVITDETTPVSVLGDIVGGDGMVTELDAYAANKKAAMLDVEQFEDKYTYIIADVDGDGIITALDALMISKLSAGEIDSSNLNFVTGK